MVRGCCNIPYNILTLFGIYGTTYGAGDGSTTFNLPDFRNRVIWGATEGGYIGAGLPNITGGVTTRGQAQGGWGAIAYSHSISGRYRLEDGGGEVWTFDASRSSAIYGASSTVQPPAIKARVYTRYQ